MRVPTNLHCIGTNTNGKQLNLNPLLYYVKVQKDTSRREIAELLFVNHVNLQEVEMADVQETIETTVFKRSDFNSTVRVGVKVNVHCKDLVISGVLEYLSTVDAILNVDDTAVKINRRDILKIVPKD